MRGGAAIAAVAAVIVVGLFALMRTDAGQFLLGRWSFTKSVVVDHGYYFRLKVKLAYKGEPQDFDIVVGCNVRVTTYKDNSNTYEAGLVPTVFGRRMSDGKGLVVRPPDACRGETTANRKISPTLLPLVIVYDDAANLAFGEAYLSDDAYEAPSSVLRFFAATIEPATRGEFDKFRESAVNLVTPAAFFALSPVQLRQRGLIAPPIPFSPGCFGYARFRLLGKQKEAAQRFWPPEHPEYWEPQTAEDSDAIDNPHVPLLQTDRDGATPQARARLVFSLNPDIADRGLPRREAEGNAPLAPSYFPDFGEWRSLPWPTDMRAAAATIRRAEPRVSASIDFKGGRKRGFAYCRVEVDRLPSASGAVPPSGAAQVNIVDGQPVFPNAWGGSPLEIIERDEFVWKQFIISLGSPRGDV